MQEYRAAQSRHSSLSPHDWLDQEEGDSDVSEEYYSEQYASPEETYTQPYRNGQAAASYRNGHGTSSARLKPVQEQNFGTGSNSSLEFGDI